MAQVGRVAALLGGLAEQRLQRREQENRVHFAEEDEDGVGHRQTRRGAAAAGLFEAGLQDFEEVELEDGALEVEAGEATC